MNGAGMHGGVVADGHVGADVERANLVGGVQAGSVLYVRAVTDFNICHIAADHGVEPYGTLVAHRDFAHDGGTLAEIAALAPLRGQSVYFFY